MRLPKLTTPVRVLGAAPRELRSPITVNEIQCDTTRYESVGIAASECGCKHGCLGPCVFGNCLGTCHGIGT